MNWLRSLWIATCDAGDATARFCSETYWFLKRVTIIVGLVAELGLFYSLATDYRQVYDKVMPHLASARQEIAFRRPTSLQKTACVTERDSVEWQTILYDAGLQPVPCKKNPVYRIKAVFDPIEGKCGDLKLHLKFEGALVRDIAPKLPKNKICSARGTPTEAELSSQYSLTMAENHDAIVDVLKAATG